MKRTRLMIAFAFSLLVAQIATAQMMGNGPGGNHQGSSPSTGYGMDAGFGAMGQTLAVGTDGVVYTQRVTTAAGQASSREVVAIRPTGAIAWTAKVDSGMSRLKLSGNLVLVANGSDDDMGMDRGNDAEDDKSQLVALSAASGSVQWTLNLDGFVAALEPFAGGTYVLLAKHDTTSGGNGTRGTTSMQRTVAAVDNSGKVLWSHDLN